MQRERYIGLLRDAPMQRERYVGLLRECTDALRECIDVRQQSARGVNGM
ncbi:MAG TPA: hypothetical protein VGF48_01380 [Thermoanaerobaculia bacterium]|jgi:hypothetical protein